MLWIAGSVLAGSAAAWFVGQTELWEQWVGPQGGASVGSAAAPKPPVRGRRGSATTPTVDPVVAAAPQGLEASGVPAQAAPAGSVPAELAPTHSREVPLGDLLARASHLRGDGRYRAAQHVYLRALSADPTGAVGQVSAVAAAAIRLEHLGNPRGAIKLYQRALTAGAGGHLALEAYWGLARAHRELAHPQAELRALESLLNLEIPGPARVRALARRDALRARFDGRVLSP